MLGGVPSPQYVDFIPGPIKDEFKHILQTHVAHICCLYSCVQHMLHFFLTETFLKSTMPYNPHGHLIHNTLMKHSKIK